MDDERGAKVLILRHECALSPERKAERPYEMRVDTEACAGEGCGCNRLCTRIFGCPGLVWDEVAQAARIDEVICVGCGVCADVCPQGAILKEEN